MLCSESANHHDDPPAVTSAFSIRTSVHWMSSMGGTVDTSMEDTLAKQTLRSLQLEL